ncbi:MAG: hypothetical protein IPJ62_13970 [Betaproteobacteria bacterium]|nr:hypothetical protein [Betaproteobacteria bacterium]
MPRAVTLTPRRLGPVVDGRWRGRCTPDHTGRPCCAARWPGRCLAAATFFVACSDGRGIPGAGSSSRRWRLVVLATVAGVQALTVGRWNAGVRHGDVGLWSTWLVLVAPFTLDRAMLAPPPPGGFATGGGALVGGVLLLLLLTPRGPPTTG